MATQKTNDTTAVVTIDIDDIFDRFAEQTAERELKKEQRKHA